MRVPFSVAGGFGLAWIVAYLLISQMHRLDYPTSLGLLTSGVTIFILLLFSGEEVNKIEENP
jgi:xanthine/uracil/vitamin C permease (AzgA family)